MKNLTTYSILFLAVATLASCSKSDTTPVANDVTLHFNNTFQARTIVLGDANSTTATKNVSGSDQTHHFSELKYVISNIRLVKTEGGEIPYHINDLDKGATVVNHADPKSLDLVLKDIPVGEYKQIKFGLGVRTDLNILDQVKAPKFYAAAGENNTEMHWEWGVGYRFTKIEGFYGPENKTLSIHTGSTVEEGEGPGGLVQGVDAYREISLNLPAHAVVGRKGPKITIRADFDNLLTGKTNTIKLGPGNATPSIHTADNMVKFVDNLGGNGTSDLTGMFSVESVENE